MAKFDLKSAYRHIPDDKWLLGIDWNGMLYVDSIAAKELLPIIVAATIWGSQWIGATVLCHCDNEAVVASLRACYCKDPTLVHMLRCLFFVEAKYDMSLSAVYILGIKTGRNLLLFFTLLPQADLKPYAVPDKVVKLIVRERTWTSADWSTWLDSLSMGP